MNETNELFIYHESKGDIAARLLWIFGISLLCFVFVIPLALSIPPPTEVSYSVDNDTAKLFLEESGWRVGAGLLLAQQCAMFVLQMAAPDSILRARLVSNSLFSLLICGLAALACALTFSSMTFGTLLRVGLLSGYCVTFVAANITVSLFFGAMTYKLRKLQLVDANEMFWALGSAFLVGALIWLLSKMAAP